MSRFFINFGIHGLEIHILSQNFSNLGTVYWWFTYCIISVILVYWWLTNSAKIGYEVVCHDSYLKITSNTPLPNSRVSPPPPPPPRVVLRGWSLPGPSRHHVEMRPVLCCLLLHSGQSSWEPPGMIWTVLVAWPTPDNMHEHLWKGTFEIKRYYTYTA